MDLNGFYYIKNAISLELSKESLNFIDKQKWDSISSSSTGRKVQQYGYKYDYITRSDTDYEKIKDIPEELLPLRNIAIDNVNKLIPELSDKYILNQCIINKYEPGQGISAHIDKTTFGPVITCFTLGSGTTITFSKYVDGKQIYIDKYVEPNSLYIMSGESRYEWKHQIKSVLKDDGVRRRTRISVTFRTVDE